MSRGLQGLAVTLAMAASLAVGTVMGMEFDPSGERCASRVHLLPQPQSQDCTYEQSTEQPGDEVCR